MLITKRMERLNRFILKALTKAVKAGLKIIELYTGLGGKIEKLKKIVSTLQDTIKKVEEMLSDDDN